MNTTITRYAGAIMRLIVADVDAGTVPAEIRDWADLDGFVDANMYFIDAGHEWIPTDEGFAEVNAITDEINRRITVGDLIVHQAISPTRTRCDALIPLNPNQWVRDHDASTPVTCTPCRIALDEEALDELETLLNATVRAEAENPVHYANHTRAECQAAPVERHSASPEAVTCGACVTAARARAEQLHASLHERNRAFDKLIRHATRYPLNS